MDSTRPVALITGSARRIGAAIAHRLHAEGYDLALHYRGSADAMQALARMLETTRPDSVLTVQADLSEFDRLPEMVARTVGRFGRLDALVNNASTFHATPMGTSTAQDWDTLFASNARAPFFLAQAAAPHLKASRGAIVNLVDIYAERPLANHPLYCMAKAALLMATKSLALELAPEVRVNAVAPGAILAITFTRKAARECQRRWGCGKRRKRRCWRARRCHAPVRRKKSQKPCAGCCVTQAMSLARSCAWMAAGCWRAEATAGP